MYKIMEINRNISRNSSTLNASLIIHANHAQSRDNKADMRGAGPNEDYRVRCSLEQTR